MRIYKDENNNVINEFELLEYYNENKQEYFELYGNNYNFEYYLKDCTSKNGTLELISS